MPKFLIIRFSSIGDIIQCMGIIDGIREHFSRCRNPLDRPKRYVFFPGHGQAHR